MPHISIEYTNNINTNICSDIFKDLTHLLVQTLNIKSEYCKCRAIKLKNYHLGSNNSNEAFVHLEIKFLKGRSSKIKTEIGEKSLEILKVYFKEKDILYEVQHSVEIKELQHSNYTTSNNLK